METQQPQQQQLLQLQQQHIPFRSALLAGAVAGTAVDLSLFPLDTLKTRLQSARGFFASGGFAGIYRGVGSAVVGSAPGAAFFFCTYESTKRLLTSATHADGDDKGRGGGGGTTAAAAPSHMLAASLGEVAACAVRVPTEVVKQRAQAGQHGGSSRRALAAILRGDAAGGTRPLGGRVPVVWRELYRGWAITVFREVPFTVIQFPLWEAMKSWRRRQRQRQRQRQQRTGHHPAAGGEHSTTAAESAVFGSVAGAVAAACTTPLDVLKTRVMLSERRVSVFAVARRMARREGVRPFFAGIVPRVTWISIGGAVFLGSYQCVLNALQIT